MNITSSSSLPIQKESDIPWHPETLWDIRNLELGDLPEESVLVTDGYVKMSGVISGHPEDIKEKMEGAFLHFPCVCFARNEQGVIMFETVSH